MTELLVQWFPAVALLLIVAVLGLSIRLRRRLGQAAYSAGPAVLDEPTPLGQSSSPWELQAIQNQLNTLANTGTSIVRRYDVTATVNRLTVAAGLTEPWHQLSIAATEADLAAAITRIEAQLGLPPLTKGTS